MHTVYLGIGSNLGSREENCNNAIKLLSEQNVKITSQSSMIETKPWGVEDQPDFINMAIEAETSLEPDQFLALLKTIEERMGRQPAGKWGPRIIDLDILLYDDLVLETDDFVIPHPEMGKREFVLRPLAEIAPDLVHPVLKKSIRELLDKIMDNKS